jgi:hypothetical protein
MLHLVYMTKGSPQVMGENLGGKEGKLQKKPPQCTRFPAPRKPFPQVRGITIAPSE